MMVSDAQKHFTLKVFHFCFILFFVFVFVFVFSLF